MKILLIGATGNIGQRILKEALNREYEITAAQRHPENLRAQHQRLTIVKGDLLDKNELPSLLDGHDLIISAISAGGGSTPEQRLIIVGGAGNTEVAPGIRVVHSLLGPGRIDW